MKIDDPLDAFPVHGVCGAWGVISVGIFAYDSDDIAMAGYSTDVSQIYRLGIQVLAIVVISLWSMVNGIVENLSCALFVMLTGNIGECVCGSDNLRRNGLFQYVTGRSRDRDKGFGYG